MRKVHTLTQPGVSQMLDYVINIYCKGRFVKAFRYEGYSGTAVHDEAKDLAKQYPASKGYTLEW
jgi:hypothetical protein